MYKKILLAIDESADSGRAIEKVINLQKKFHSEVVVFHSISTQVSLPMNIPIVSVSSGDSHTMITSIKIEHERKQAGINLLNNTKDIFEKNSVPVEVRLIEDEKPDKYIYNAINEEGFDLIVLGCEGNHSKLRRMLLETIPEKILNKAPADVLIIR
ncbi:MAG: universal stress protein [Promethearchaeota archaeon]|nr:MAG: universal stress protein [Candidatus Lokiarchaeota archaeon]